MRMYKKSGGKRKVEAEENCWPVDCMELQDVLPDNLDEEKFKYAVSGYCAAPAQKVAKIEAFPGNRRQLDN